MKIELYKMHYQFHLKYTKNRKSENKIMIKEKQ